MLSLLSFQCKLSSDNAINIVRCVTLKCFLLNDIGLLVKSAIPVPMMCRTLMMERQLAYGNARLNTNFSMFSFLITCCCL